MAELYAASLVLGSAVDMRQSTLVPDLLESWHRCFLTAPGAIGASLVCDEYLDGARVLTVAELVRSSILNFAWM
jgi:hypothetical protein